MGYLTNVLLVAWKGKTRIEDKAMECICQGLYEDPSSCELSDLLRQVTLYPPYHPLRFLVWQAGTVFFVQFTLHGCHKNKILKTFAFYIFNFCFLGLRFCHLILMSG